MFRSNNLIWFFGLFGRDLRYIGNDDLRDDPWNLWRTTPPRDLDLNHNPPRVTLRSRVKVRQRSPPTSNPSFLGNVSGMPGARKGGGGGGAGGKKPGHGSPARRPPLPQGPSGSPHTDGGSCSNTRMSHNKEAVPRDANLGNVEKHGLRRSTTNSNCEAVGNNVGLGAVGKHGHHSSTSNLSASPRSGGAGATSGSASRRSGGSGAIKGSGSPPPLPPPPPCGWRGRRGWKSSRACSTSSRTNLPTSSPLSAGPSAEPSLLRRQVQGHLDEA